MKKKSMSLNGGAQDASNLVLLLTQSFGNTALTVEQKLKLSWRNERI